MNRGSDSDQTAWPAIRDPFNEAPIHESGKSRYDRGRFRFQSGPSMRPRFMNRGSILDSAAACFGGEDLQ